MKTGIKSVLAVWMLLAVSGMMRVCGLEHVIFFNKGIISVGVVLLGWVMVQKCYENWKSDSRRFWIGYVLALGLVFTELLGTVMLLHANGEDTMLYSVELLWIFPSAVIMACLIAPFFYWLIGVRIRREMAHGTISLNKVFFVAWAVFFVGFLPCVMAFYPGLYCYDMGWQWTQFIWGSFSTHHPLVHTIFSAGLIELGNRLFGSYQEGLFLHSLVQLLILSGSMAFAIRFLVKWRVKKQVVMVAGAFFLLFPFFPVLGISTTKDTIFGCLFLVVFVCVCDMIEARQFYEGWRLAGLLAVAVLMCLFRNNAVHGLVVMAGVLVAAVLIWRKKQGTRRFLLRMTGMILVCVVVSQGIFTVFEKGLNAAKGSSAEMLSLPMQQMARSYVYHQKEFTEEERRQLTSFFDEASVLGYDYYLSDTVKAGMKMEYFNEHKTEFLRLWLALGKKFPQEYLFSPLYNTFGLWFVGGDSSCYMEYGMLPPVDAKRVVEIQSRIPWLREYYSWFDYVNMQNYLPGLSVFFYTSFYSWCVAVCSGILLARRRYLDLVLPLFLACYGFTLAFGPCIIVRYFFGIILCVPILIIVTLLHRQGDSDNAARSESV